MNGENLLSQILFTLVFVAAAMGLWYLGQLRGSLKLKQIGVMIGILPLIVIVIQLVRPSVEHAPEYRTIAQGPTSREQSTSSSTMIPVTDTVVHEIELTAKYSGGSSPADPVHVTYQLLSPDGAVLTQGEEDLKPTQGARWSPAVIQFQPSATGEHSLKMEIPQPVNRIDILVREIGK